MLYLRSDNCSLCCAVVLVHAILSHFWGLSTVPPLSFSWSPPYSVSFYFILFWFFSYSVSWSAFLALSSSRCRFQVLGFGLWSIFNWFLYSFILPRVEIQLIQQHLLKKLAFTILFIEAKTSGTLQEQHMVFMLAASFSAF